MNRLWKLIFFLSLCWMDAINVQAQIKIDTLQYNVETLTVNDGLSQGLISCMLQDKEDIMWFGTKDGLNKYDGYQFTVYRKEENNSWSIQGNYITGIVEDDKGYLWVGTYANGLFIFDKQTERFYPIKTHLEATEKIIQPISPLAYKNGCIFFGNEYMFVYQVDHVDLNQPSTHNLKKENLLFDSRTVMQPIKLANSIIFNFDSFKKNGSFWFNINDSLFLIQVNRNKKSTLRKNAFLSHYSIQNKAGNLIEPIPGTNRVIFANLQHLAVIDTLLKKTIMKFDLPAQVNDSRNICADQKGDYFIIANGLLYKYITHENKLFAIYPTLLGEMCIDKNNVLWIGNGGLGIYKIDQRKNLFHHFNPRGALHSAASYKKEILVRQRTAASVSLTYVNPITLQSREIIPKKIYTHRKGKNLIQLVETKQGLIVFISASDATNHTIYIETYDPKQSSLKSKIISFNYQKFNVKLLEDNKGILWFNYVDSDKKTWLCKMNTAGIDIEEQYLIPGSAMFSEQSYISSIYHDEEGILWITSIQGFYRFNPNASNQKEQWNYYNFIDKHGNNLPMNHMLSLLPDPQHPERDLWIGTDGGGLLRFDKVSKKFMRYTTKQGLPNDVVYAVLNDEQSNLWMSTNAGLSCFLRKQNQFINFNVDDGLPGNEFNRYEYHKLDKDHLFFSGTAGGVYFNPKEILETEAKPNIIFTGLTINNKPIHFLQDSTIIQKPIQFAKRITLPPNKNLFTVSFAALNYGGRLKKFYRYKLLGYSSDWVEAGNRNEATYTNLSPGSYTLVVQAAVRNAAWNTDGISLEIIIQPKWFQTWWFKLSILLAVSCIVFIFIRYRWKQQVAILHMRNTIAADLHDEMGSSLSSITLFSEVAEKMSSGNESLNGIIQKIKTNALEVQETMGDIVWAINTRHETLDHLLKRMRGFAVHVSETQQFKLHFPSDENIPSLTLDPVQRKNLYLVFKEAFNNSVKYAHCTQIRIELELDKEIMQLKIIDNGKGFDLNEQSFEPTNRGGGNGLFNMYKRAETLGGKLYLNSTIGEGTTVQIVVQLKTNRKRIL